MADSNSPLLSLGILIIHSEKGKISYYASEDNEDMTGYFTDLIVGGFANTTNY